LEQRVTEVLEYYATRKQPKTYKGSSGGKVKEMDKFSSAANNSGSNHSGGKLVEGCPREVICSKRMQELMRQFGTILKQASIDFAVVVIKRPMDFSTIKNQMEAKEGSGYKNVREIYADVRLVFTNAMTYNDGRTDIHVMAKTLLEKFEEKWLQLLPKVVEELDELNLHLEKLRELVIQKCSDCKRRSGACLSARVRLGEAQAPRSNSRRCTSKRHRLGALARAQALSASGERPALLIKKMCNLLHSFFLFVQSESTLWKLKLFVKGALELQAKNSASKEDDTIKRKKEIYDAVAKTTRKRNKKIHSL
ncbi:hypothetical protein GW17_00029230, partial [Ensete ventricosum]